MGSLIALEQLYDRGGGDELALPDELAALYGALRFPAHAGRAHIFGNFVSTLDGVVAMKDTARVGGGDISGHNRHDRFVMGLLRAVADAVIVGAGTQRAVPRHRWTAEYIYPPLAGAYQRFRRDMRKRATPLNVIVTAGGNVNLGLPVFQKGEVEVLIVTTESGMECLREQVVPPSVRVAVAQGSGLLSARSILEEVAKVCEGGLVLVEGGPRLMGEFVEEHCLDEMFLTLAPQIAGREGKGESERPGFVMGKVFAPERSVWGELVSVKRAGSHLFLRYALEGKERSKGGLIVGL